MNNLPKVLKDLFVDLDKNESAMHGSLYYNPESKVYGKNKVTGKYGPTGDTKIVWDSYGKDLHDLGIYCEKVEEYGGEDCGSDYYCLYSFSHPDSSEVAYFKFQGWYQSYNGADFSEVFQVYPKEVTMVKYFRGGRVNGACLLLEHYKT